MSAETLTLVAGSVLSLIFTFIPKLNTWYAALPRRSKEIVMFCLVVAVGAGSFVLACKGQSSVLGLSLTCDVAGAVGLVKAILLTLAANQATYMITRS